MVVARARALQSILGSTSPHRVIIAGPGTGKSFTFSKVLEQVRGPALVLTFLGNLARDLRRTLGANADARTFHSFSRKLLHLHAVQGLSTGFDYYPPLPKLITEDLKIVGISTDEDRIAELFMNVADSDPVLLAALERGNYYDAVSHTDSVYRVHRAMASGQTPIPTFSLLMVDEYQDFSLLEARFIEQLATQSPSLVVGDDDQALYQFKHAKPEYLRIMATSGAYERFELPFCTRCTQVLVAATHRIVEKAMAAGLLAGRLDKSFHCYLPEKQVDSVQYPKIIHAKCSVETNKAPYMSRYVLKQIQEIPASVFEKNSAEQKVTVLVLAPEQFLVRIHRALLETGRTDCELRKSPKLGICSLDGYRRIALDPHSRLGWRVLMYMFPHTDADQTLRKVIESGEELSKKLDSDYVEHHLMIACLLKRLLAGEVLSHEERVQLESALRLPLDKVMETEAGDEEDEDEEVTPNIVLTSLTGSKGLQADFVFVVGLMEKHIPRTANAEIADTDVCQFLVALTRARKLCTLVSCDMFGAEWPSPSIFLSWLQPLLEVIIVDKTYWKNC